ADILEAEQRRNTVFDFVHTSYRSSEGFVPPSPQMLSLISHILPPMTRAISMFIPGRNSEIAWRNAENNAEIIRLVVNGGDFLPAMGVHPPLGELMDRCYAGGTFPSVWSVEGLGHYYADTFYDRNLPLQNLLTDPALNGLPSKSMTMLHAGIGLSFAQQ